MYSLYKISFLFSFTFAKMAEREDSDHDSDDFSDDEFWNNAEFGALDLAELTEEDRAHIVQQDNDNNDSSDESGDELRDYNVPLFYQNPRFEWTHGPYVSPDRVTYTGRPGPTRVLDTSISAIGYFGLFYSETVFESIVTFTNANAAKKRREEPDKNKGEWTDVSVKEIKAFYGMIIMMDVIRLDRDHLYWDTGSKYHMLGTNIAKVMSRDRFFQIKRYLFFRDPGLPVDRGDKLFKIRHMIDTIRTAFVSEYQPHKQVTVDEAMVPFKGRLSFKQYMKDKPVKFGIKVWVAADSVTAYCYNFDVYVGKHGHQIGRMLGLSSKVVIGLTQSLQNKGHIIYTDNFYTSPVLARYLFNKGTYLCGTVRPDRKGFPRDLIKTKREQKRLERGHTEWRESRGMVATAWKDKRVVYYISTAHPPDQQGLMIQRRQKDGTPVQLHCPPTASEYSQYMGGVDRLDQMTRMNKSKRAMRWYRRVERKLLETSIYNAYVIEGHVTNRRQLENRDRRRRDYLSFKMDLAHELVGDFHLQRSSIGRPRSDASNNIQRLDRTDHLPVKGEGRDHCCVLCYKRHCRYKSANPGVSYADNPFKKRKSVIMCNKCNVYLCCNESNCFFVYHTQVNL